MSCTSLWRERDRDVKKLARLLEGGRDDKKCFWPGKCKTILKGFLLVGFNNLGKNFLLLLFFYCFRIMCDNRYLTWESWKMVFSLLLVGDWCLFLIQWDWSCVVAFLSNGAEIDFVSVCRESHLKLWVWCVVDCVMSELCRSCVVVVLWLCCVVCCGCVVVMLWLFFGG